MRTDDLIARLARAPVPAAGPAGRLARAVPLALALRAGPMVAARWASGRTLARRWPNR